MVASSSNRSRRRLLAMCLETPYVLAVDDSPAKNLLRQVAVPSAKLDGTLTPFTAPRIQSWFFQPLGRLPDEDVAANSEARSPTSWHHVPAFPTEVGGPVAHQAASTLEEITARIGRLCRVAHRMGERRFDHFAGCVCLFRRPVPEARPEPMRHGGDAEFFDQFRQRHVGERLPAWTAEHQAGTVTAFPCVVQERKRLYLRKTSYARFGPCQRR